MEKQHLRKRFSSFLGENRGILILMAAMLLLRLMAAFELRFNYSINSDDACYIQAGFYFAQTGTVAMPTGYPSAQIMPGMPWLIGTVSLIFGQGLAIWKPLKLLWILMGTLVAWFVYKSVCVFAPKWCGLAAAAGLLAPNFIWLDNLILTETPSSLCLSAAVYCTLQLGEKKGLRPLKNRYFIGLVISCLCGLLLRGNFISYPIFAAVYLLVKRRDWKLLLKQGAVLAAALLCFIVPWTIRNYMQFHAFIPISYGSGNPMLLGTYQGIRYPGDEELDYEANVTKVVEEKFAEYYGDDGKPLPQYEKYISLEQDAVKAAYRLDEWRKRDFKSLLYSNYVMKAGSMINGVYYDRTLFGVTKDMLYRGQVLNTILCCGAVMACLYLKKYRKEMGFLLLAYLTNIFVYATAFAYERYNASLMPLRMVLLGLGFGLFVELLKRALKTPLAPPKKQKTD